LNEGGSVVNIEGGSIKKFSRDRQTDHENENDEKDVGKPIKPHESPLKMRSSSEKNGRQLV
jgi:hypothetical protein